MKYRATLSGTLVVALCCISGAHAAVWYEVDAASGNPLVTLSRMGVGYEYTRDNTAKHKLIPNATWALGPKDGKHDWSVGIELPVLANNPKGAPSETGWGDFKVRLTHVWLDDGKWLVGSYFETEFDTADADVQEIANQRTQMAFGTGFIRKLGNGWAVGANLQYGWSIDSGTTTGCKSEWEFRAGVRKTLLEPLNFIVVYKGTVDGTGSNAYGSTIEPSLAWTLGANKNYILSASCEVALTGRSEDFIAKGGFSWIF